MKKGWTLPLLAALAFAANAQTPRAGWQPGMGTVMHEYGYRFYVLYYAAKAGNWPLAEYQLHEQLEIQEVGEAVRPAYAGKLKTFEEDALGPVAEAVGKRDFRRFEAAYGEAVRACNRCHTETGHGYIRYELPKVPPPLLSMEPVAEREKGKRR
jgi:cytochrome c553